MSPRTYLISAAALAAALALAGCSSTTSPASAPPDPSTPTTTAAAPPADGITGYGATVDGWDSAHTEDHEFQAGAVYNSDPGLPQVNGHTGAKYTTVDPQGGRVTSYTVNFLPASLPSAESLITREFPTDTQVLWTQKFESCVQVEYSSPTLHKALGHTQPGDALVEFTDLQDDGADAANPTQFNQASMSDLPGAQPDPSSGC